MTDLLSLDPEISLSPRSVIEGLASSDPHFEARREVVYLLLRGLANVVYRARTSDGCAVVDGDASSFKTWLEELAEAVK